MIKVRWSNLIGLIALISGMLFDYFEITLGYSISIFIVSICLIIGLNYESKEK